MRVRVHDISHELDILHEVVGGELFPQSRVLLFAMHVSDMSSKCPSLGSTVRTELALERSLSSVRSQVFPQLGGEIEFSSAVRADVLVRTGAGG